MLLFKTMVLCWMAVTTTAALAVVDVLDARSNETYDVHPRATAGRFIFPTVQFFAHRMRRMVVPDKNLFFSGPGDYEFKARIYAQQHDLRVLVDFMDPTITSTDIGGDVLKEYWRRVSQAYSEVTVGKTYVLLPGDPQTLGATWYKGTIWDTVEWPILQENSAVSQILRINPTMSPAQGINLKPAWTNPPSL